MHAIFIFILRIEASIEKLMKNKLIKVLKLAILCSLLYLTRMTTSVKAKPYKSDEHRNGAFNITMVCYFDI